MAHSATRDSRGRSRRPRWALGLAMFTALAVTAAACSSDDTNAADSASTTTAAGGGAATTTAPTKTPKTGGVLVFAQWSRPRSLDPFALGAYGSTGGIEMGALYDRLVEWDPVASKYVMRTAESLTPNATSTEWTLKVRSGIKFSDGTPYDAEAVKINFDRQKTDNSNVRGLLAIVTATEVVDPLTVKFTLSQPWGAFPVVFTNAAGMIASPTAMTALGKDGLQTKAVGAGAFVLDSYLPGEKLTMKRNPNYWGDPAHLDGLDFRQIGGGSQVVEALAANTVQAGYLRDAIPVAAAKSKGFGALTGVTSTGEMILINNGLSVTCAAGAPAPACTGKADGTKIVPPVPGSDLKVRKAIAAAIDVNVVNQRANDGKGVAATSLFAPSFPWNPGIDLPKFDAKKARDLVTEAKAAGWNGTVRFTCGVEDAIRAAESLAVSTLLEAAGIKVNTDRASVPVNEQVADVITKRDYDLACWGLQATPDDGASSQFDQFLRSTSASNRGGYASPDMDAALNDLQKAQNDDQRKAAYKTIAELWNRDVPSVPLLQLEQGVFWTPQVMGMRGAGLSNVSLDKVWLDK
jgi:peptide/nickel transport system substrate-binding protein